MTITYSTAFIPYDDSIIIFYKKNWHELNSSTIDTEFTFITIIMF